MKLIKTSITGLPLFKEKLEIDFFTEQNVMSDNTEMLFNPFKKIFLNNVISVVGKNASGKTSLLKVVSFILEFLNGESLNSVDTKDILGMEEVFFELIFYDDKDNVYNLSTKVNLISDGIINRYVISEEILYKKKTTQIRTKKDMVQYDESDIILKRNEDAEFLKDDISIVLSINKSSSFKFRDLISTTNLNFLRIIGDFPKEIIEFLDPNIKRLSFDSNTGEIKLEFYGVAPIILSSPILLENYLSSGTIKGINIFLSAIFVLKMGGYLIVDEIENHFNREIVATLIRFFKSEKTNTKGATLIFSTHYSELLDEIDRNDSIYIVRNKEGIASQKLCKILKRNDIKKSEVFKSGYLEGVVPRYDSYIKLKNLILENN